MHSLLLWTAASATQAARGLEALVPARPAHVCWPAPIPAACLQVAAGVATSSTAIAVASPTDLVKVRTCLVRGSWGVQQRVVRWAPSHAGLREAVGQGEHTTAGSVAVLPAGAHASGGQAVAGRAAALPQRPAGVPHHRQVGRSGGTGLYCPRAVWPRQCYSYQGIPCGCCLCRSTPC